MQHTEQKIAQNETRIEALKSREVLTRQERMEAEQLKLELEQQIADNQSLMADYDEKIAYLSHVLETSEAEGDATAQEKARFEQRHATLSAKRTNLLAQYESLQDRNQQLVENVQELKDVAEV